MVGLKTVRAMSQGTQAISKLKEMFQLLFSASTEERALPMMPRESCFRPVAITNIRHRHCFNSGSWKL